MPDFPPIVFYSIPAFVLLLIVESISYSLHPDDEEEGPESRDTRTSLIMGGGSLFWDNLVWALTIGVVNGLVYGGLYALTPLRVPYEGAWVVAWLGLTMVAYDFCYYWSHREHHLIRILWASHVVHHSSQRFNLSTALRQPWTSFVGWIFYLPLALLGFHPVVIAFIGAINLVYQFWIHTERIGKLPRWFELVFNTPSHHRVHHASQGSYLDRNFGGVLIVWDRVFGSFAAERERPIYGLTHNISTYNPFKVAFHEYGSIWRDVRAAPNWNERMGRIFKEPGWSPDVTVTRPVQSPASPTREMPSAGPGREG